MKSGVKLAPFLTCVDLCLSVLDAFCMIGARDGAEGAKPKEDPLLLEQAELRLWTRVLVFLTVEGVAFFA